MSLLTTLLGLIFAGRVAQDAAPRTEPRATPRSSALDGLRVSERATTAFASMDLQSTSYRLPRHQ